MKRPAAVRRVFRPAVMIFTRLLVIALLAAAGIAAEVSERKLVWDETAKEIEAKIGQREATLTFGFTNSTPSELTIHKITTSCGCTAAKAKPVPWMVPPGATDEIRVTMDLRGRSGLLSKTVFVQTSAGVSVLNPRVRIPQFVPLTPSNFSARSAPANRGGMNNRLANLRIATADRQAVFKGDCARCHVEPARGKTGKPLYAAACGICHDAEHRAAMVPDLTKLARPTPAEYWRHWIEHGKPNSLMPAFAQGQGGPLSDAEVESLVEDLSRKVRK